MSNAAVGAAVRLQGCYFPFEKQSLVLIASDGGPHLLPVFESKNKLKAFMRRKGFTFDDTGQISDQDLFLRTLPRTIGVAHNPSVDEAGITHWNEVLRGS